MTKNSIIPHAVELDSEDVDITFDNFEKICGEKACAEESESFYIPVKIPPPAKRPNDDDGLLDLSDESTLDKLSSCGLLRIRPEGRNVVSVAFFKPAIQAKT